MSILTTLMLLKSDAEKAGEGFGRIVGMIVAVVVIVWFVRRFMSKK